MSNRKYKSSSQSTYEKGVAPARGKEQDKRNTATEAASPALTPAPPLAQAPPSAALQEPMNSKLYPSHQINKRPFNVYSHYFGKNINFRKYYHYKNRRNKTFTKSINNATQKISESNRYITNLSSKTLTLTQTKLLTLSFPIPLKSG